MILQPAPGALSEIPVWASRPTWLDAVDELLDSQAARSIMRRQGVSADTCRAVARADAAAADSRSGRDVATSNATVGRRIGRSARQVQRARAVLVKFGYQVPVVEGRYLTVDERRAAGGRQIRAASTRALTHPPRRPPARRRSSSVALSRRGTTTPTPHVPEISSTRMRARGTSPCPRPIGLQRLAAAIATRMPWLVRYRHIGVLVELLGRRGIPEAASASAVLRMIEEVNRASDRSVLDPVLQRDPVKYFAWLLGSFDPLRLLPNAGIDVRLSTAGLPARDHPEKTRTDEAIMHPKQCIPSRVDAGRSHRFDRTSGWCIYGCGVRDDGRIVNRSGTAIAAGPEYDREELDYLAGLEDEPR